MILRVARKLLGRCVGAIVDVRAALTANAEREFRRQCLVGKKVRITDAARCFNHSGERERVRIGRGVVLDGIVACHRKGHLSIGDYSFLGRSRIYCVKEVRIGEGVLISDNVAIMDSDMHSASAARRFAESVAWAEEDRFPDVYEGIEHVPVIIGDYAWIGFGACILKGVTLGRGVVVGAGAVVTSNVPDWSVVAGNPARVVASLEPTPPSASG